MTTALSLDQVEALIRTRRSSLRIDPERPVAPELIARLCELVTWAPNHKRTHPWRFAVLRDESRARLGGLVVDAMMDRGVDDPEALGKARVKYLRAPVMLIVGSAPHEDPVLAAENRDAVAAGVQNLLLAAHSAGLNAFWSTGTATVDGVKELVGFPKDVQVIAAIYLGWPAGDAPPGRREPAVITWVESE